MRAEPIFVALSRMEGALRDAEAEAARAKKDGNRSLEDWLENFVSTTRVWLDHWRDVVKEANRTEVGAAG